MKKYEVTVTHAYGLTTEVVYSLNEISAKRKAQSSYNKRLSKYDKSRIATGAYISNKGS